MRPVGSGILVAVLMLTAGCLGALDGDREPQGQAAEDGIERVGAISVTNLSKPVYELAEIVETFVESHDGTVLHTAEYRPNVTADTKTPVVIQLSPYFGNTNNEAHDGAESYYVETLVPRGYTVVFASVRGTGYSGGCYQLGGADEIQDAYELVEHYHEAAWSNGNVGMIGASYPGTTPWQAAITNPPGLKTIVPIAGITDMYRYDHVNGASYTHGPFFPTYYTALTDWTLMPANAGGPEHVVGPIEAACPGVAERFSAGYETWLDGDHDAFWDEREYEARVDDIEVPVFLVHGLQDWNVDPDNGVPIFNQLPEGSKAWLGQWAHNIPYRNTYEDGWDRHDWNLTLVAWFDHHLKGIDNGVTDELPVLVQASQGQWHREAAWPPAEVTTQRLYLTGDGALDAEPGPTETLEMGPWHSAEDIGGEAPADVEVPDPLDEVVPDQVVFTSQPLASDTLIVGQPTVTLNLSIDAEDGHLVADLYDADAEEHAWLGHAILNLAHRDSRDAGEPMTPGQSETVTLTFFPMDAWIPEDHRLQIVLKPEDPGWIHLSPEQPSYEIQVGGNQPASFAFDVRAQPVFEPAPEQDEVPWSE